MLHSGAWAGANGGDGSTRSREGTLRNNWKEVVSGAKKSLSSEPETFKSTLLTRLGLYVHFMGHGNEVEMAKGLRQALDLTKTPKVE